MPITRSLSSDRLEIQQDVSESCIDMVISDKNVKVIQTSHPISSDSWKLIGEKLIKLRPDIEIRIYGHYSKSCDLSTLDYIPNVENLSVDCLRSVSNFERVERLRKLRLLSVGIYNLDTFSFLESLPDSIEKLFLGATKSKKPSLEGLTKLAKIRELYIEGQNKELEVIGELRQLEKLVLRFVSPADISFIRKLPKLWSLDIKLGGIKDLHSLEGLANLKYLELWQVKGLSDISVISSLVGLQYIFLQSLTNVVVFPDLRNLINLRRVYLETMKGLQELDGLFNGPALEEFIHVCAQNMSPEQYEPLLRMKSLQKALFGFASGKKNSQIELLMEKYKINKYTHEKFKFL